MHHNDIRQSFCDFFVAKQHTVLPAASLLPDSPGLLFTNAGMNPFVPFLLGEEMPPFTPARATNSQKCIRAGGKHNDLEDVGYDTYHHTFFEMLGNWSFGDYFKKEAIHWAWQLLVDVWKFPASRLYVTVYQPAVGDPAVADEEARSIWTELLQQYQLDPKQHILNGDKKDNFWMMGNTGPCGPCSEIHIDLTSEGNSQGALVNQDSPDCIELWNLVFMEYNAKEDGSFEPLQKKHVDTGMGLERIAGIMQGTNNLKDFKRKTSNYGSTIFATMFTEITALTQIIYRDIYPENEQDIARVDMQQAIAFRIIADHIRTLAFSIADGILPGNTGREYVLRRILRRAVRYGRNLQLNEPFLAKLVPILVADFGDIFPVLKQKEQQICRVLTEEEELFNRTLDKGITLLQKYIATNSNLTILDGAFCFQLYDTYGFPLDLTTLLAKEKNLTIDQAGFEVCMQQQQQLAKSKQKQQQILTQSIATSTVTEFIGYVALNTESKVTELHNISATDKTPSQLAVVCQQSPFYTAMGGQIADHGELIINGQTIAVQQVIKIKDAIVHFISSSDLAPNNCKLAVNDTILLQVDAVYRQQVSYHHTATHLLHKALHQIISTEIQQKGSAVNAQRLRFDFNANALSQQQIKQIEQQVNIYIASDAQVFSKQVDYVDVKDNTDIIQMFGEKYGNRVRVVQIGGDIKQFDGFSMELCGGTHANSTGQLQNFVIKKEEGVAAGIRRIEALCGSAAEQYLREQQQQRTIAGKKLVEKINQLLVFILQQDSGFDCEKYKATLDSIILDTIDSDNLEQLQQSHDQLHKQQQQISKQQQQQLAVEIIQNATMTDSYWYTEVANPNLLEPCIDCYRQQTKASEQKLICLLAVAGASYRVMLYVPTVLHTSIGDAGTIMQKLRQQFSCKGGGRGEKAQGTIQLNNEEKSLLEQLLVTITT